MSPVTHFLTGWVLANAADLNRRDRAVVTLAAVVPDVECGAASAALRCAGASLRCGGARGEGTGVVCPAKSRLIGWRMALCLGGK